MGVSKIIYDGVGIDLTQDTAVESDVASGKYFHKANGDRVQGTASGGGGGTATFPGTVTITFNTTLGDEIPYAYRAASQVTPTDVAWTFGLYDPNDPQDIVLDIVSNVHEVYDGFYIFVHDDQSIDSATNAIYLHCMSFNPLDDSLAQYGIGDDYNVYYVIPTASTCTITITD